MSDQLPTLAAAKHSLKELIHSSDFKCKGVAESMDPFDKMLSLDGWKFLGWAPEHVANTKGMAANLVCLFQHEKDTEHAADDKAKTGPKKPVRRYSSMGAAHFRQLAANVLKKTPSSGAAA